MTDNKTTPIYDDAGDQYGYEWEDEDREDCPVCGGTGLDDTQCACGDDTCCCLVPTPLVCSWCEGEG